jgi:HlyD family secretion protein
MSTPLSIQTHLPRAHPRPKRTARTWAIRTLGLLLALALVVLLVAAWLPKPVPVDLSEARVGKLAVTVDEDGQARVKDRFVVSAPLSGNLARIEHRAGDHVEKGAVLARIIPLEPPLLDARSRAEGEARLSAATAAERQTLAGVERAKLANDFAQKEVLRQRDLLKREVITPDAMSRVELEARTREQELASAEFGARVASHEAEVARISLGRVRAQKQDARDELELTAPVAGQVLKLLRESEGAVQAATPLLELGDPASLEVVADVLTTDAVTIPPGAAVAIEGWGGPPLKGHVRLVEPSAFTRLSALGVEEQRVNAVIDFDEPRQKWAALGDGFRVELKITVWQTNRALLVPESAVFRHGEGWALFRVQDGVARLAPIELGRRNGSLAQVLSGIEEGATVVLHPSDRVGDGVQVAAR